MCSLCYLDTKGISGLPWRIDVVSIELDNFTGQLQKIDHFKDAVEDERR